MVNLLAALSKRLAHLDSRLGRTAADSTTAAASAWSTRFAAAIADEGTAEVLDLLAEMPRGLWQSDLELRRWLNPLGRNQLYGLQLSIWAQLHQISGLTEPELDRAIRLIGSYQSAPTQPVLRQAGFDPILILCTAGLENEAVRSRRGAQINRQCALHLGAGDRRAAAEIASLVAASLDSASISRGLQQVGSPSLLYVHGLYNAYMRRGDYLGAQRTIGWLAKSDTHSGAFLHRYVLVLVLRNHLQEAADAFTSRRYAALGLGKTGIVLNRTRTMLPRILHGLDRVSTERLVQIWLASDQWHATGTDIGRLAAELNRRDPLDLSRGLAVVLDNESAVRQTPVRALAVQRARKELSKQCVDVFRRRYIAVPAPAAAEAGRDEVCETPVITDFVRGRNHGPIHPVFEPPPTQVDAIVSFSAPPESLLQRHPTLKDRLHIRLGKVRPHETGVTAVGDLPAVDNSELDFHAARRAELAGIYLGDHLALAWCRHAGTDERFKREFVALVLEDRLYPGLKRQASLIDHLKRAGAMQVVVIADAVHLNRSLELAFVLEREGVNVTLAFDSKNSRDRRAMLALIASGTQSLRSVLLKNARDELDASAVADLVVEAAEGVDASRPAGPANGRPTVLIIASLSDPSYRISTIALARRLEAGHAVVIFSPTAIGADIVRASLDEAQIYTGSTDHLASLAKVRREMAMAVDKELNAEVEGFPPSLLANLSRLSSAASTGLATDLDCLDEIVSLMALHRPDAVLTMPGRMTSARAATIVAQGCGIPVMDLQAFFISRHPRYKASLADIYGGITEDQLDIYRAKDPPQNQRIERIGSLMIGEQMSRVRALDADSARVACGVPAQNKLIVYGAQHGQGQGGDEVVLQLVRAVNALSDTTLIIKVHPRTPDDAMDRLGQLVAVEASGDIRVVKDGDIYQMMIAADLVATQFSNIGLEAALIGKPVLSINLTGEDYIVDLVSMGVAERGSSPAQIIATVHGLLHDENMRSRLKAKRDAYFQKNPELGELAAASRVEDLVGQAVRASPRTRRIRRL